MPGRGDPWREGGHIDETILSEDIKDGTISEADLDSALQVKVNSGGGGGGGVDVNTEFRFYDEFMYNVFSPNDHWESSGGIGAWATTVSAIGGVITKNSAGEGSSIMRLNVNQNSLVNVAKDFICRWRTKSAVVSLLAVRQGLIVANSFPAGVFPFGTENTPYIWFTSDGTGVTTNWLCETHDGSLQNSTDSGVAIDTAFHLFEVERTGATITFRIDGSSVATFTINLPTGNLQMIYTVQDGENVQKTQSIDTAELQNTL